MVVQLLEVVNEVTDEMDKQKVEKAVIVEAAEETRSFPSLLND